jgi:hypothetical protein
MTPPPLIVPTAPLKPLRRPGPFCHAINALCVQVVGPQLRPSTSWPGVHRSFNLEKHVHHVKTAYYYNLFTQTTIRVSSYNEMQ